MASVTQTSPWLAHRDGNWTMPSDPVLAAIDLLPALGLCFLGHLWLPQFPSRKKADCRDVVRHKLNLQKVWTSLARDLF